MYLIFLELSHVCHVACSLFTVLELGWIVSCSLSRDGIDMFS